MDDGEGTKTRVRSEDNLRTLLLNRCLQVGKWDSNMKLDETRLKFNDAPALNWPIFCRFFKRYFAKFQMLNFGENF